MSTISGQHPGLLKYITIASTVAKRRAGMAALEAEMKMLSALGCRRIAAPPAGVEQEKPINIEHAAAYYREILQLGRKYNVMCPA